MPYKNPEEQREAVRQHYLRNKERIANRTRKTKQRRLEFIRSFKKQPCVDCKQEYPHWIMEFDHVRGEKLFCIGDGGQTLNRLESLLTEIAKCEVVCANCHKTRTWNRQQTGA